MPGVCPRCFQNVYFAEEKLALGKVWHILCFSCRNCRKLLDSCTVVTYEGDLFCKKCCPRPTTSIRQEIWQSKKDLPCCCCCCYLGENVIDNSEWRSKFINTDKLSDDEVTNCSSHYSINSLRQQLYYNSQKNFSSNSNNYQNINNSSSDNDNKPDDKKKVQNISLNLTSLDSPRLLPENQLYEGSSACLKNLSSCRRVSFQYKEQEEKEKEKEKEEEEIMEKDFEKDNSLDLIDESVELDEKRLRGGSGCCCSKDNKNISHSNTENGCCLKSSHHYHGCGSSERTHISNEETSSSSCGSGSQGCGSGGSCGGGCRGNCGKPGQFCHPAKTCTTPNASIRRTHHYPPIIDNTRCNNQINSSKNPYTSKIRRQVQDDNQGCGGCRPKTPVGCECLGGGGLDCQRCGRKVYHAEMHFASGVPYHSICFSCHCCRKPLETLTYHENCGEIYCKQCYVRNFGPQGYGYSGVLQTPM